MSPSSPDSKHVSRWPSQHTAVETGEAAPSFVSQSRSKAEHPQPPPVGSYLDRARSLGFVFSMLRFEADCATIVVETPQHGGESGGAQGRSEERSAMRKDLCIECRRVSVRGRGGDGTGDRSSSGRRA